MKIFELFPSDTVSLVALRINRSSERACSSKHSRRNITMDNYFTTLPFAKHLLSWKLTATGTLRPYIPKQMAANKLRPEFSSLFGFHERNVALCSYVPEKNKTVILLSTMHSDTAVNVNEQKKPHMIMYYNKYKTGVDTMDRMVSRYICYRRTQRWSLEMVFDILDVGALAAYLTYCENNNMLKKNTNQRRIFLHQLSEELAKPFIEDHSSNKQNMRHHSTTNAIEDVLGVEFAPAPVVEKETLARDSSGRIKVTGSCHLCYPQTIKRRIGKPVKVALNVKNLGAINIHQRKYCVPIA